MAITLDGTNGITTPDLTVDTDTLVVDEANNRVGIGTSSPGAKLDVYNSAAAAVGNEILRLRYNTATSNATGDLNFTNSGGAVLNKISSICTSGSTVALGFSVYNSGLTEAARIDSSGNLLVGTTSMSGGVAKVYAQSPNADWSYSSNQTGSGTFYHIVFRVGGTAVGSIISSSTTTSYNTTSDYRLKENVVGVTGAAARVQQLNPVRFNFIADPDTTVDGFLAHEVQDVVPEAIVGTKDAVDADGNPEYQGIDQSKLVPLLTAALQEALTKIDSLETRIAALEAA